jgi:hypothetical protein
MGSMGSMGSTGSTGSMGSMHNMGSIGSTGGMGSLGSMGSMGGSGDQSGGGPCGESGGDPSGGSTDYGPALALHVWPTPFEYLRRVLRFKAPSWYLRGFDGWETKAIEDWLESKSTDPMTGENLKIKALFTDDDMNE